MTIEGDPPALSVAAPDRDRRVVIERVVREIARALLTREQSIADAVAALAFVVGDAPAVTPRESVAASRLARNAAMMTELLSLENDGRATGAVSIVARKFARDPRDPVEVESLKRTLRRLRVNKSGQCPVAKKPNC